MRLHRAAPSGCLSCELYYADVIYSCPRIWFCAISRTRVFSVDAACNAGHSARLGAGRAGRPLDFVLFRAPTKCATATCAAARQMPGLLAVNTDVRCEVSRLLPAPAPHGVEPAERATLLFRVRLPRLEPAQRQLRAELCGGGAAEALSPGCCRRWWGERRRRLLWWQVAALAFLRAPLGCTAATSAVFGVPQSLHGR